MKKFKKEILQKFYLSLHF